MTPSLVAVFAMPLALTLAAELPVAALFGIRSWRGLGAVALINLMTNPPLVWILLVAAALFGVAVNVRPVAYWGLVAVLEGAVVLVEWRLARWALGLSSTRAAWLSVAMNATSFALGIVLAGRLGGGL